MAKISAQPAVTMPALTDQFAVNQGGTTKRMTLAQARNLDWVNVKDYGAAGNGVADDTAAITAALAACPAWGTIYLPGVHKITSTIDTGTKAVTWVGARGHMAAFPYVGSTLLGDFSGPLLRCTSATAANPTFLGLSLINTATGGGGIWLESAVHAVIRDVQINCKGIGIYQVENTGGVIDCCQFLSSGTPAGSIAMLLHGLGTVVIQADVTAFETGMRIAGIGARVLGGRFENNKTGIVLGVDENGDNFQSGGLFQSIGFEANNTAIDVHQASGITMTSIGVQGSVGAPAGLSIHGINISGFMDNSIVESFNVVGGFSVAAIKIRNAQTRLAFRNGAAANTEGTAWDVSGEGDTVFTQTNKP